MKTTIELPDDLMIEVKKAAAERRTTIRQLVERGLRRELAEPAVESDEAGVIHWVTVDGGLPPDLDVADRASLRDWVASHDAT
jgi:hypothetical protein